MHKTLGGTKSPLDLVKILVHGGLTSSMQFELKKSVSFVTYLYLFVIRLYGYKSNSYRVWEKKGPCIF